MFPKLVKFLSFADLWPSEWFRGVLYKRGLQKKKKNPLKYALRPFLFKFTWIEYSREKSIRTSEKP